jgi:type IV pilus assembly protein PilO
MDLRLNKLPWYGQVGLFVVIALSGVVTFYYLYVEQAQAEMAQQQQLLDTLRTDINKGLATARTLPQFRADVADLEARLDSLKAVLPEQKDFADLLRSLQTLAAQSNLTIRVFKPGTAVPKQLHLEWPIAMELDGTYHNLGLFFDRISKFARIINLSNVSIRAKDRPEPNATVTVACTANTFVLLDGVKAAMGKPGAPLPAGAVKK